MNNSFTIDPTIYPFAVFVCHGTDDEALEYFVKVVHEDCVKDVSQFITGNYLAHTVRMTNGDVCIHFTEHIDNILPIIVHEAFHVVEFILEHIGIEHCAETSEAYAYYLQYLFTQIYNQLK